MKNFSHVKDSNSGVQMSRSFNSLTLVFTKIKICYFSFVKAKKFPMIFTFEGFKVTTSKLHRQILEPYLYFFFSIFLFLKKKKKTKTTVSNLLEQISSDFRLLSFYQLPSYYVAAIYLSKAHKKYSSNRAQFPHSQVLRAQIPKKKKKKRD